MPSINILDFLRHTPCSDLKSLHRWSVEYPCEFWSSVTQHFNIYFQKPYTEYADLTDIRSPRWWIDAKLNIAESCFQAPEDQWAIISGNESGIRTTMTYGQLKKLSFQIAHSLKAWGVQKSDPIALLMPMHEHAVALYLGAILAGASVVSIAESFSAEEIAQRLSLSQVRWIVTQPYLVRAHRKIPLYSKIAEVTTLPILLLPNDEQITLRPQDRHWHDFLVAHDQPIAESCDPDDVINILFSSGTTATPKLIPWTHTTPIKCASDAYFHQNIQPGDRLCWPTSLGWMMGPWLIFAALLNQASLVLFDGSPTTRTFTEFASKEKITMLGMVPSLVKLWRAQKSLEGLDWSSMKVLSSSGECSQAEDMQYIMDCMNQAPMIEYCGGTEIGGAYITSVVCEPNVAGLFHGPALGLDFVLLDEQGQMTSESSGEVALIGPSMGLSTCLLGGRDHHEVYYEGMPLWHGKPLRRHGDQVTYVDGHLYRVDGRIDDAMNLGGIKISATEIEHCLNQHPAVYESAAIGVPPVGGGPSQLIVYVVLKPEHTTLTELQLKPQLQQQLSYHLNPLFKIERVIFTEQLPRTASNKMMRRLLRKSYLEQRQQ